MHKNDNNPGVSFTDYLSVLLKWKNFILINLLVIGLLTTGITFLLPQKYKASTTVMIQESQNNGILGSMASNLSGVFGKAFGGSGGNTEDKLFGFLSSNKLAEKIINKYNLVSYYDVKKYKRESTLKAFREDFKADLDDNGFIRISMIHKNPIKGAEIVNYAVDQLIKINQQFATSYAKKYRQFVEKRYHKNLEDIRLAEDRFEKFQKQNKIYAIPEQLDVAFKAYADLEKELSLKELERDFIKEMRGKNDPSFNIANSKVLLLKNKIDNLKKGEGDNGSSLIFLDIKKLPKMQKEFLEIKRELEIQTKLLEFTLPMYEQAVMDEQKTIPAITVIDKAIPPEIKYSPKKAVIIFTVFFISLFIIFPIVFRGNKMLNVKPRNKFEQHEQNFYKTIVRFFRISET